MHSDFHERALRPITPHQHPDLLPQDTSRKPLPAPDLVSVLGYTPRNRKERRKAEKLLRQAQKS